jgi:hypothetical protein
MIEKAAARLPHLRRWSAMLADHALEDIPGDVSLVASIPGFHVTRPNTSGSPASGSLELGRCGGCLMGWNKDQAYADNLAAVLHARLNGTEPTSKQWDDCVTLERQPENPFDPNAVAVFITTPPASAGDVLTPRQIGYLFRSAKIPSSALV